MQWVSTDDNPADVLTKAIASPSKFEKFQAVLLGGGVSVEVVKGVVIAGCDRRARCFLVRL